MDALSARVSSVQNDKTVGVQAPPVLPLTFWCQPLIRAKVSTYRKKRMILGSPHTNRSELEINRTNFSLVHQRDLIQLLPEQTPCLSLFLNVYLFLSLCIVLSRYYGVQQLANSKLRRLPPLTFDWWSDRSSEFLWRVPPKWGILPLSSVSTLIWDIRAEDRLKQKFWSFISQIYKQVKRINSLWKKLSI